MAENINDFESSERSTVIPIEEPSGIILDPEEEKVLNAQIKVDERKQSYFTLYRFATKFDWMIMFIGLLFSAGAGAAMPVTTIIFGKMIDFFTQFQLHMMSNDEFQEQINYFALIFVYLAISIFFATYLSISTWVYSGERLTRQIREHYLRAILRQNIAYFDKYGAGEITTRITSDTHLIQDGISEKASLSLQVTFIIAFTTSWKMTLVICSFIPYIIIISGIQNKFAAIFTKRGLDSYSRAGIIAEEAISTIRTAVAFGSQKKLSNLYDTYLIEARKEGHKKAVLIGFALGLTLFGIYATYSLAFWFVIIGAFALANLSTDLQAFSFATGAGSKIFEAIDRVPSIDVASDAGAKFENVEGRIQLKNINFVYPARPEVKILNGVSLDIEAGTTVALVGSSGSGKSTIVSLVLRFYDPVSGEVLLDGHNIKSLNLTWLRRQISLVGQEPVLFNTTIAGNVAHGLIGSVYEHLHDDKKREMIEDACKMANAHDFIMNLPDKYETMVGERGFLLSGGQKQRIAIARAIVKDPKILLLDEATSALDTRSEGIVQDALDKASKGRTTIVIAHRLSTIRNATKIVVMNKGVIVEMGTHKELMDKKGPYFNLVEAQQINQALSTEKDSESQEDEDELFNTKNNKNKNDIPEEDNQITRVITNKSVSSAFLSKQKADIEKGMKHEEDYTTWELLKKIAYINKPEFFMLFVGLLAAIVSGGVYPVFAIIFSSIIQAFSEQGDDLRHEATFWSLMFLVIAGANFFSNMIQQICFGFSGERLTKRIRSMTFASILRQDIAFFDEEEHSVGTLTGQLSLDASHVNGLAGATLGSVLQVVATIIACVIVGLVTGWKLTLVCLCAIPLLVGSGALRMKMQNGFQQKTKKAYEHSAQIACEGAANIRTVAALTREEDLWNIYHNLLNEPMRQGFNNAFLSSTTFAFAQTVNFLINALAFWYGSRLFMDNEYDLKKMFTVFMAIVFGSMSAGRVFAFVPDMAKAKSASATIISLLERVPLIDTWRQNGQKVERVEGHIKFNDVHFRYPTRPKIPVLRGLNLDVKPGQFAALVGPSGCGKSTSIGLLERFYQVTGGSVTIDGMNITTINVNNLREHIALVSQEPSLYDMTIKENILFGCRPGENPSQDDIERVCREANIHEFIVGLPNGYETRVGGKGTQFSGGQKQRIAIARALIRNPKILLLDEATSALDSESEKIVQRALDAAARGRTTLAIAHRLSTIQHADVIFVLKDGNVHEQGTHQELLNLKGTYYMMVQEQHLGESN
ncbi:40345_t:CDS:2 [Gigaspora margarita]|uniref:40345_t:CDS:1 n=1 Tax=Gigaspora margarita TaxID=4874 RepID=A0ABN7UUU9_GIGMA|nr:40345_t:CDS:2 [Gigaspora margarita]